MFPFFGFRNMHKNQANITKAIEKMNKGDLQVEDILDDEELVSEMKSYTYSQLMNFLTPENLIKLIKFITVEPEEDSPKRGHKFPYNASEILCSENVFIIDKFFKDENKTEVSEIIDFDKDENNENDLGEIKQESFGRNSIIFEINNNENTYENNLNKYEELNLKEMNQDENLLDDMKMEVEEEEVLENVKKSVNENDNENIKKSVDENDNENVKKSVNENDNDDIDKLIQSQSNNNPPEIQNEKLAESLNKSQNFPPRNSSIEYPVINELFKMLESDSDLNYVLAGYFYKFFNHISSFRNNLIVNYLFLHKTNFIALMIKHLNRKSIADSLLKLMCSYSVDVNENEIKKPFLMLIIENLHTTKDSEKSENIYELISEMIQNRRMYYLIAKDKEILEKIFENLKDDLPKNLRISLFKIIIKFLEQVIKDVIPIGNLNININNLYNNIQSEENKENEDLLENNHDEETNLDLKRINSDSKFHVEMELKNYLDIFEIIYVYLDPICESFKNENNSFIFNSTFDTENKSLGIIKFFEIEYFKTILELIVNIMNNPTLLNIEIINYNIDKLIDKIIKSQIFEKMIKFFFEYELNNFYQITFEKIFIIITNKCMSEKIIKHIFVENNFIQKIIDNLFKTGLQFKSGSQILPGYFPVLCNVGVIINNSENEYILNVLNENDEWKYLFRILIHPVKNRFIKGILHNNQTDSPFQRFNNKIQQSNVKEEDYLPIDRPIHFRIFVQENCLKKFENFKEKRSLVSKEGGYFDVDRYIKEEEEIKLEETNLAVSINIEDESKLEKTEIEIPDNNSEENSDQYYDNFYYWKHYQVDVDISEL